MNLERYFSKEISRERKIKQHCFGQTVKNILEYCFDILESLVLQSP